MFFKLCFRDTQIWRYYLFLKNWTVCIIRPHTLDNLKRWIYFISLITFFIYSRQFLGHSFGSFKPPVNSTDSSITTPALDGGLNASKSPKSQKPPLYHTNAFTYPTYPFYCKLSRFFIAIHKKSIFPFICNLRWSFGAISDPRVLFPDISVLFCGMKEFFSTRYSLDCKDLSADMRGGGTRTQRPTAAATPSSGTPRQIRRVGESVARLAEVHTFPSGAIIHSLTMLLISASPSQFCHNRGDVGCLLIGHKRWKLCCLSETRRRLSYVANLHINESI